MAQDFGNGVSRTLSAAGRQYQIVVWQASKPPLDSELNLVAQVDWERAAETIRAQTHSGFLLDPMVSDTDFVTNANASNWFRLGNPAQLASDVPILWANVNGWMVPVTGTSVSNMATNQVNLFPAPDSSSRIDLVFLEVWMAQIAPNPSTGHKPSADMIWKYGNVLFGGTNETDEMEDPTIGFETTERLQLQYRIRVVGQGPAGGTSVALDVFPDGLDDPNVLAQGSADDPVAGITWTNMKHTLGDPGLWRAGNGDPTNDLGTVDGYSYAIPICAVFRRNSSAYVALTSAGNANQNGAMDRNPVTVTITDPAQAARTFDTITLTSDLAASDGAAASAAVIQVNDLDGSGFDNANIDWASTFLTIGDEIIGIDSVDTSTSPATMTITAGGRGHYGTQAAFHPAGTSIGFYCYRPDGRFADQVTQDDILDLRRSITLGEWDYEQLLAHNLGKLFKGDLRTSYKQSGISDTAGSTILEVDSLFAGASVPNQTEHLDGPDGIRTVFSDAITVQNDVSILLSPASSDGPVSSYVSGNTWEVGAGFVPAGYQTAAGWNNGTIIDLFIGGTSGSDGARATAQGEKFVRFATPWEQWLTKYESSHRVDAGAQHPVSMTFIGGDTSDSGGDAFTPNNVGMWANPGSGSAARETPGPMVPLEFQNFERPFIFLGGVVNDLLHDTSATVESTGTSGGAHPEIVISGADFDTEGIFWSGRDATLAGNSVFADDPSVLTQPLFHGQRTLWSMLTNDGKDLTGASSELYVVVRGDTTNNTNNNVWKVVGAGTAGAKPTGNFNYTSCPATASDRLAVEAISVSGAADFVDAASLTIGVRSQRTHTEDGLASTSPAAACIVITDLEATLGETANPWNSNPLGSVGPIAAPITCDMVLNTALVYGPGRGATGRVADIIDRFGMVGAGSSFLRQSPAALDTAFPALAGVPDDQTDFPIQNIQTWNRLSSRGLSAPKAPAYGGERTVFSEMEREAELFVDPGSKTVLFRPYQKRDMTLVMRETEATLMPVTYPAGYSVDGAGIFLTGSTSYSRGYPLPPAYMPRFGRQDIPYYVDTTDLGTGNFLGGVNHLFKDGTTESDDAFNIIGGNSNSGSAGIRFMFAQTIATATTGLSYGEWGNVPGGTPYADDNGYQARLYEDVNVISSDVPRGLRGIQLPPFLGVARLIAVYDVRDWDGIGAYDTDRVTPISGVNTPVNLLRTDADKQTLYIVQDGGFDLTDHVDDHTYVIPDNVIDITRSPDWTANEDFEDLEYIVEFECFGFARGFINKNNYVLAREFDGEGDAPDAVINTVPMIIPAAADYASSSQAFVTYRRTVYQGDPYMTRDGETRVVSDYEYRYGRVLQTDAVEIATPIQQFDSTDGYSQVPLKVNERTLEVLAYADFWTTLGTGKIGGLVYPGTITDVGHVASHSSRIPALATTAPWQPEPRTFTQRQTLNASRSSIDIVIEGYTRLADVGGATDVQGTTIWLYGNGHLVQFWAVGAASTAPTFLCVTSNEVTAQNLYDTLQLSSTTTESNDLINAIGVRPIYMGGNTVRLEALHTGAKGGDITVEIVTGTSSASQQYTSGIRLVAPPWVPTSTAGTPNVYPAASRLHPHAPYYGGLNLNRTGLLGGVDLPVNGSAMESAGSPLRLTGLTERLPLGILVQDSDFIGEDPLRDGSSALRATAGVAGLATSIESPQILAEEYTRPLGAGSYLGMSDGGILRYAAYDMNTEPTGTRKFRIYRGASIYSLDPLNVGGPVDWATHGMSKGTTPVLKGAMLVGRAFLVRNYEETAFTAADTVSHGDEVQMVIATRTVYGQGPNCVGYSLTGEISPTGYGKGYSSSDRYRLEGKPFVPGHSKAGPDPDVQLAPYPNEDPAEECVCP